MAMSLLVDDLVSKQSSPLSDLFTREGARPPVVIWNPRGEALSQPLLQRFSNLAQARANSDGTLDVNKIDLRDFGELRDWMLHIRFQDEPDTHHHDHVGCGIAAVCETYRPGIDIPSQDTDEPHCHESAFLRAVYRAIRNVRKPILTEHQPLENAFVGQWRRLLFPLTDGDSDFADPKPICGCLCLAYADNELSPGLETLTNPVIVLDAHQHVLYANRPARVLFNNGRFGPWGGNLFDFSGIQVTLPMEPRDMHDCGRVISISTRYLCHALLTELGIRVTGLRHNSHYFYLLEIRPED